VFTDYFLRFGNTSNMKEQQYNPYPNRIFLTPASEHPDTIAHFKPLRLRGKSEAAKLHGLPNGIRIRVDESKALQMMYEMLSAADTPELASEVGEYTATVLYGSSRYLLNDKPRTNRAVQTRHADIPILVRPNQGRRADTEERRYIALLAVKNAWQWSEKLTDSFLHGSSKSTHHELSVRTGRSYANTAGHLAVIGIGDTVADLSRAISDPAAQHMSRDACLNAMQTEKAVSAQTGVHTGAVQIVDSRTPTSNEWQLAASDGFDKLYQPALNHAA
jgi:hypothetical protein